MLLMTWEVMIVNANLAMNMNKGHLFIKSLNFSHHKFQFKMAHNMLSFMMERYKGLHFVL